MTPALQLSTRRFSGARSTRVIGAGNTLVDEHSHDWPVLSLYIMGDYRKRYDGGEVAISGPSAVLHGAGESHANRLSETGLEQIDVEFDPRWLAIPSHQLRGITFWNAGPVAAAASRLLAFWSDDSFSESQLAIETKRFFSFAFLPRQEIRPKWLSDVQAQLRQGAGASTAKELARDIGLHPGWLAQAYRQATGEGLRQTLLRRRIEHATKLLRGSDIGLAEIAADAGFCDQSHMNRAFRHLLGRTPAQVRAERSALVRTNGWTWHDARSSYAGDKTYVARPGP